MKSLIPGLILHFLLFLLVKQSFAQGKEDMIGVSFGAGNFHITDAHSSPLIFRGTGIAPSITWQHTGARYGQNAEGSFFYSNLSSSSDNFSTENFRGRFRYTFLYKTSDTLSVKRGFEFSFGASVTSFYCKSDYYFYIRSMRARAIASWYWSQSVDLALQLNYFFSDRNYLGLQLNSPIISSVSRPPYSSSGSYDYDENDWIIKPFGTTVFFPGNLSVNTNLFYQAPVSPKLSIRFNWEFYYLNYTGTDDICMYMNNFRVGIFYLLKKSHD
jgi:hypothetical protein